jgi:hypothetical protein
VLGEHVDMPGKKRPDTNAMVKDCKYINWRKSIGTRLGQILFLATNGLQVCPALGVNSK